MYGINFSPGLVVENQPHIANLSAALRIKGCVVQDQRDLIPRRRCAYTFAVFEYA